MTKTGTVVLVMFILMSCGSLDTKNDKKTSELENLDIVGGDRDEYGCIGSAGYTWSQILQDCIRVWETGLRLNPIDDKQSTSAFVVFNSERSKLELFLPTQSSTIILFKSENEKYSADDYQFDANTVTLTIKGKVTYKN